MLPYVPARNRRSEVSDAIWLEEQKQYIYHSELMEWADFGNLEFLKNQQYQERQK